MFAALGSLIRADQGYVVTHQKFAHQKVLVK